jgi:NAD(P)-dependent dehydrogenase (short-subunit alcohol dehydrogenase family)
MMLEAFRQGVASKERYIQRTPIGRVGRVDDIANVVAFLASERASFVNGVNLRVDGGWVAWANPDGEGFSSDE